jgi:hypothetical protein
MGLVSWLEPELKRAVDCEVSALLVKPSLLIALLRI